MNPKDKVHAILRALKDLPDTVGEKSPAFVTTYDALAQRLTSQGFPVTRRSIQEWRNDPQLKAHCPRPRADGRHEVAAWQTFMVTHQLARADQRAGSVSLPTRPTVPRDPAATATADDPGADGLQEDGTVIVGGIRFPPGSESDWKKKLLEEQVEQAGIKTRKIKGELLVASELEVAAGQLLAGIATALNHFPGSTARFLVGLRDIHLVQQRLESEINVLLQRLNACAYLDDCLDEVIASLREDAEARRLLELVTFVGQDQAQLFAVIGHVTQRALAAVGARVLRELRGPGGTIENTLTGQVTPAAEEAQRAVRQAAPGAPPSCANDAKDTAPPARAKRKTPASSSVAPRARKASKRKRGK